MKIESIIIRPVTVTLDSSNATETVALWNSGTAYTAGQLSRSDATNRIYKALQNNTNKNPVTDTGDNWADVAPTNRYAMFDDQNTTQTTRTGGLTTTFTCDEFVDGLGLYNLTGTAVDVLVMKGATQIYSKSFALLNDEPIVDFWSYYFEELSYKRNETIRDIPIGSGYTITITLYGTGLTGIGECVPGLQKEIGQLLTGFDIGYTDYSVKERDPDFGTLSLVERGYTDDGTFSMIVEKERWDDIRRTIVSYRARGLAFLMTATSETTQIYGVVMDIRGTFANKTYVEYQLIVESMLL